MLGPRTVDVTGPTITEWEVATQGIVADPDGNRLRFGTGATRRVKVVQPRNQGDPLEALWILGDGVAQPVEEWAVWHPDSAAHEGRARLQVEVESRPTASGLAPHTLVRVEVPEPARRVGLVRRLVPGEPDVTVDPKHRPLAESPDVPRLARDSR